MCVAILIGIIGYGASVAGSIPMFTTSSQSETVIIQFAHLLGQNGFLLSLVAGVVLAGILACTMSTADSQLLTAASGVSQNLLQDFLKIKMSTAASMNAARLTVMGIAIVAVSWHGTRTALYSPSYPLHGPVLEHPSDRWCCSPSSGAVPICRAHWPVCLQAALWSLYGSIWYAH